MRAIMLVLDGLGVGAMDDVVHVRPQDKDANTLLHVAEAVGRLDLPVLNALGLGHIQPAPGLSDNRPALASFGQAALAYQGADSYLGHQELMGTIPLPAQFTLMQDVSDQIETALAAGDHTIRRLPDYPGLLVVDEAVVIADNLEADPGQNINVTAALAEIAFDAALRIGQIVRDIVQVARVIVFGGPELKLDKILSHIECHTNGQTGVNSPALHVYNEKLVIRHLGYGVDPTRQIASILADSGGRVSLLGKMADLIVCPQAQRDNAVPTLSVMQALLDGTRSGSFDFMAATVQETDLAGHEADPRRFASVLQQVDQGLEVLLPLLTADDVLIITADHGNDPTSLQPVHTRERVPVLVYQSGQSGRSLGLRTSLADMAATVAALFKVPMPQDGVSIAECVV